MSNKPILVLDFDGVLHAYSSGWQGVDVVPDGPTPGAMAFLRDAIEHFDVCILSSRSSDTQGHGAMCSAVLDWLREAFGEPAATDIYCQIRFPLHKPPAFVTIDDRAITFTGTFPPIDDLRSFAPWNKRVTS